MTDGRLTLEDGTLAGADLDMISAVRFMHRTIGIDLGEALRMASLYPAEAVGQAHRLGRFSKGAAANIVALSDDLDVRGVWIDGQQGVRLSVALPRQQPDSPTESGAHECRNQRPRRRTGGVILFIKRLTVP